MLSFKMTTYHPYKVNLSEGQKDKLEKSNSEQKSYFPEVEK